jgi:hypothetical protein
MEFRRVTFAVAWTLAITTHALADVEKYPEACRKTYEKLYAKDTINISFFFGNMAEEWKKGDNRDGMAKTDFVGTLTRKCGSGENLCGFNRDPDDAELFFKTIAGPDGKEKKIRFRVMNPSLSAGADREPDEEVVFKTIEGANGKRKRVRVNSAHAAELDKKAEERDRLQEENSRRVLGKYKESLASDDVVIFQGHSEYGAGPSFGDSAEFPVFSMTEHIRKSPKKPDVIGLIVCNGEAHYGNQLHEAAPKSALLLTRQRTMIDDGLSAAKATFEALLGRKCKNEVASEFRKSTDYFFFGPWEWETAQKIQDRIPRLSNFFEPIDKPFPDAAEEDVMHEKYENQRRVHRPSGTAN